MIKNMILMTITRLCWFAFLIGLCCLDTEATWPLLISLVSGVWIVLFTYANCFYYPEDKA